MGSVGATLGGWPFHTASFTSPSVSALFIVRHEETTNLVNLFRCNLLPSLVRFLAIQLYHLFYSGLVSSHCAPDEIHAEVQLHCNTLLGQLRGSPQIYIARIWSSCFSSSLRISSRLPLSAAYFFSSSVSWYWTSSGSACKSQPSSSLFFNITFGFSQARSHGLSIEGAFVCFREDSLYLLWCFHSIASKALRPFAFDDGSHSFTISSASWLVNSSNPSILRNSR